jgi:hypothetical protein
VVRSAQPTELLLRHVQLSKDLEEERRANFTPAMERNGHGPSIAMHPAFMASRLATSYETEGRRDPLELARCGARHARFRSCPSAAVFRAPDAHARSVRTPARARPEPLRACP